MFSIFALSGGTLQLEAIIEPKSLVWEERYSDAGRMQAVFVNTADALATITCGKFAALTGSTTVMYIYGIKARGDELWAYGYEAKALLQKQGMLHDAGSAGTQNVKQAIIDMMEDYNSYTFWYDGAAENYLVPELGSENLDALEYSDVYAFIRQACKLTKAGFRAKFLENLGKLQLEVWKGRDRSRLLEFSEYKGNLGEVEYTKDNQSRVTEVVAVGMDSIETEGVDEEVYAHAINMSGETQRTRTILDLREMFPRTSDMTRAEYEAALQKRAQMSLISRWERDMLTIEDADITTNAYNLQLGDEVSVVSAQYNATAVLRVVCMTRTIESGVETVSVEFGSTAVDDVTLE